MQQHIESVRSSAGRIAAALRTGSFDAPVRACPGWDLAELGRHIGFIHRWARLAAVTGAAPDAATIEAPPAPDGLADWVEAGARALTDVFVDLDPEAPTWHPFPVPLVAGVWPRRQAQETLIHAWDAEDAVGTAGPLDPAIAADGIDEYFGVMIPRLMSRTGRTCPAGVVAVRCTDTGTRVVAASADGTSVALAPDAAAEVEIVGRAEDVLLALWGRRPLAAAPAHPLAAAWLAFGGN
jgi:uncharacterized protein (TIGR03083 family)